MTIGKLLILCGTSIIIVALLAFASAVAYAYAIGMVWATPFGVMFLGALMILAGALMEQK